MEKYLVEIAGVELSIMSDSDKEYVDRTVAELNEKVMSIQMSSARCTKMEAILLCALDYLDEKKQLEKKLKAAE